MHPISILSESDFQLLDFLSSNSPFINLESLNHFFFTFLNPISQSHSQLLSFLLKLPRLKASSARFQKILLRFKFITVAFLRPAKESNSWNREPERMSFSLTPYICRSRRLFFFNFHPPANCLANKYFAINFITLPKKKDCFSNCFSVLAFLTLPRKKVY